MVIVVGNVGCSVGCRQYRHISCFLICYRNHKIFTKEEEQND